MNVFIWKNIIYHGNCIDYMINPYGDIVNMKWKLIRTRKNNRDYEIVDLYIDGKKKTLLVHRLVAETFIPNPLSLPTVNHIKGNKRLNRVGELEWATYSENNRHAYDTGLKKSRKGEDSQFAKYSVATIKNICKALETVSSPKEISINLGVPLSLVRSIKSKESWTSVSKSYSIMNTRFYIGKQTKRKILELDANGKKVKDICLALGWGTESKYRKRVRRVLENNAQRLS